MTHEPQLTVGELLAGGYEAKVLHKACEEKVAETDKASVDRDLLIYFMSEMLGSFHEVPSTKKGVELMELRVNKKQYEIWKRALESCG